MTPAELRSFRSEYRLRQIDLAELLGVTRLCIVRWEGGSRSIPPYVRLALQALADAFRRNGASA